MEHYELQPLGGGELKPSSTVRLPARQVIYSAPRSCYKGPLRAVRLLLLLTVLPALFIVLPMYLRYRVFSGQMYPVGMTDMRLIDSKISTTWCQRQVVRSNSTFNAFLMSGAPQLARDLVPVSMTRHLLLEDDMKEYWGFYLLQGSVVTVSACVRWPGASLIMIKGFKHLQQCAYIGDDSSEELEELLEANKLGVLSNSTLLARLLVLQQDSPANDPDTMRRHTNGVRFHDPANEPRASGSPQGPEQPLPATDVADHDPKELNAILASLAAARHRPVSAPAPPYRPPAHLLALPALHRHRDTNVDRDERPYLFFNDLDGNGTEENINPLGSSGEVQKMNPFRKISTVNKENISGAEVIKTQETGNLNADGNRQNNETKEQVPAGHSTTLSKAGPSSSAEPSSAEVLEDVLRRLERLGERGQRVLARLNQRMPGSVAVASSLAVKQDSETVTVNTRVKQETDSLQAHEKQNIEAGSDNENKEQGLKTESGKSHVRHQLKPNSDKADEDKGIEPNERHGVVEHGAEHLDEKRVEKDLDELRRILLEAIDEERRKTELNQKRREANAGARARRELLLQQVNFERSLNEDDEAGDAAIEDILEPDGVADTHARVNESTPNDMSNSEFWSSFSSSEEALLECDGLILNLPLSPHPACAPDAALRNAVTYRVPANGYYFFVFNSENEVQTNFISVQFDLQKAVYDVAPGTVRSCRNSSQSCTLPLDIFSNQKVVLEVPLSSNDSLWNEQWMVVSECEPRTAVYLACAVAVPLLVILLAFQ